MAKKKISVVVDNYKLKRFKKELKKWYLKDMAFTADSRAIFLMVEENEVKEVQAICEKLQKELSRKK